MNHCQFHTVTKEETKGLTIPVAAWIGENSYEIQRCCSLKAGFSLDRGTVRSCVRAEDHSSSSVLLLIHFPLAFFLLEEQLLPGCGPSQLARLPDRSVSPITRMVRTPRCARRMWTEHI